MMQRISTKAAGFRYTKHRDFTFLSIPGLGMYITKPARAIHVDDIPALACLDIANIIFALSITNTYFSIDRQVRGQRVQTTWKYLKWLFGDTIATRRVLESEPIRTTDGRYDVRRTELTLKRPRACRPFRILVGYEVFEVLDNGLLIQCVPHLLPPTVQTPIAAVVQYNDLKRVCNQPWDLNFEDSEHD